MKGTIYLSIYILFYCLFKIFYKIMLLIKKKHISSIKKYMYTCRALKTSCIQSQNCFIKIFRNTIQNTVLSLSHTHKQCSRQHQHLSAFLKSRSYSRRLPIMHYRTYHSATASLCTLYLKSLVPTLKSIPERSMWWMEDREERLGWSDAESFNRSTATQHPKDIVRSR